MKNRLCGGWTRALFTAFLALTGAFGTSLWDRSGAFITPSGEPTRIGATALVPVEIIFPATWKSAKVKFEFGSQWIPNVGVDPKSVRVGEVVLDETIQAPYTAYLPVTVTGEGWFYFHGTITFEAPEGEVFANEEAIWTERTNSLSVFAFEGEFFVGTGNDGGFRNAFVRTLRQNNEYIGLRAKRDAVDNWQLNQLDNPDETISEPKFSDKEQNRLNQIENQAAKDLNKKYYDQHPIQPKLQDAIQPQSVKSLPKKGETVTLSVNWSSNAVRASFLPVDGAAISVTNNANGKEIASGVINNGGFSFVSPDNNLSFTAKVSAGYKGDFSVKNDDAEDDAENKVIEIGFSDVNTFDIDVAINDDSDLLDIKEFEADAWSVFHAVAEMQRLASEDLGVKKERGDNAVVNWF